MSSLEVTAASADSLGHSTAWPFNVAEPAPAKCSTGQTPLKPSNAYKTLHGGLVYDYAEGGGIDEYHVPPAGFRPESASAAELKEMGFPARPADAKGLAKWTAHMKAYKKTLMPSLCSVQKASSPIDKGVGLGGTLAKPLTGGGSGQHYSQTNWSGYVNDTNAGAKYSYVGASWIQNSSGNCGCTGPTDEATWVGMGGTKSGAGLIQDGTGVRDTGSPFAWYEFLHLCTGNNCNPSEIISGNVAAGSQIDADVTWESGGYVLFNVSSAGNYVISVTRLLDLSYYDSSTAEFINERPGWCPPPTCTCGDPGCHSYLRPLTNYGTTSWFDAGTIADGQYLPLGSRPMFADVMTVTGADHLPPCSDDQVVAYPSGVASGGYTFVSNWCRASTTFTN